MRILLVDDDESLMASLAERLIRQRYAVDIAIDGSSAYDYVELFNYDLIVLDLMLPDGDGIEFCRRFRRQGYLNPLMILSAKASTTEKVSALDAGADDYVIKPFDFDELCARIRALLRREQEGLPAVLQWGAIQLDPSGCELTYADQLVRLTPKEFALMELFLRHPYRVHSLGSIIDDLWALGDPPGEDAIRTHIKGLRRKLCRAGAPKDLIKTVYGLGYRLNERVAEEARSDHEYSDHERSQSERPDRERTNSDLASSDRKRSARAKEDRLTNLSPSAKAQFTEQRTIDKQGKHPPGRQHNQQTDKPLTAFENSSSESSLSESSLTAVSQATCQYLQKAQQLITEVEQITKPLLSSPPKQIRPRCSQHSASQASQKQAQMRIHKLAGSLGSFGLMQGSKIAQKIEAQLVVHDRYGKQETLKSRPQLYPHEIAQLIQQLHRYIDVAARRACLTSVSAPTSKAATKGWFPTLLILSENGELVRMLTQTAAEIPFQAQSFFKIQSAAPHSLSAADARALSLQMSGLAPGVDPALILWDVSDAEEWAEDRLEDSAIARPTATSTAITATSRQQSAHSPPVIALVRTASLGAQRALVAQGVERVMSVCDSPARLIKEARDILLAADRRKTLRVAIADDDPDFLGQVEACANLSDLSIETFTSAQALWQWLCEPQSLESAVKVDILILDIEMPGMSGIELCKVLRANVRFRHLPILFLTAHSSETLKDMAFKAGADDFICKTTVTLAELFRRIHIRRFRQCG